MCFGCNNNNGLTEYADIYNDVNRDVTQTAVWDSLLATDNLPISRRISYCMNTMLWKPHLGIVVTVFELSALEIPQCYSYILASDNQYLSPSGVAIYLRREPRRLQGEMSVCQVGMVTNSA